MGRGRVRMPHLIQGCNDQEGVRMRAPPGGKERPMSDTGLRA